MTTTSALPSVSPVTLEELIGSSELPVLVDVWAEWCGPCHALARELAVLASEREGSLVVVSIDSDAHPGVARRFEVLSVPTMLVFSAGRLVGRLVGARPARRLAADIDEILVPTIDA